MNHDEVAYYRHGCRCCPHRRQASAFAYDGTKCKAPGNCWEPKPGFPEKIAGSKYDPKHDPAELAKQGELEQGDGSAQRQAFGELHQDRQVGLRRRRDRSVSSGGTSSEQCHARTASSRGTGVRLPPHPTVFLKPLMIFGGRTHGRPHAQECSLVPRRRAGGQGFQRDRSRGLAPARVRFRSRAGQASSSGSGASYAC